MTRNLNHPELIWNQDVDGEEYFEQDYGQKWRLFESNKQGGQNESCRVCSRQKYTVIFYE